MTLTFGSLSRISVKNLFEKMTRPSAQSRIYSSGLALLVLVLFISLIRLAFNLGYYYSALGCDGFSARCYVTFGTEKIIFIVAGLSLAAFGLWFRTRVGLFVSLVALGFAGASYYIWYLGTLSIMRSAEVQHFSQMSYEKQHLLPLAGATFWDVFVLAIVAGLIIWIIGTLGPRTRFRSPMTNRKSESHDDPANGSRKSLGSLLSHP